MSDALWPARDGVITKPPRFDVRRIREDFPMLHGRMNGQDLVYLDNAATTQKPKPVIEKLLCTIEENEIATSRKKCRSFLNAKEDSEILFVRSSSAAINFVASNFRQKFMRPGSEIIISLMEHQANIEPWKRICTDYGASLKIIPINDRGELLIEEFRKLLNPKTSLVAVTHVSNALGSINPVKEIIKSAHQAGALVLVDGAQAVPHLKVDVQNLDCDFYCFSGKKIFAPMGVGVLYGKKNFLQALAQDVDEPSPAEIAGLGVAIDYIQSIGLENIEQYENELRRYATEKLLKIPRLTMIGNADDKVSIISFVLEGIHARDMEYALDARGVVLSAGDQCAKSVLNRFGAAAVIRVSLCFYNTHDEVNRLVRVIEDVGNRIRSVD